MTNTSITVHRGPWLSANNTANNSTTGSKSQSHSRSTSNDDEKETESPALRFMERYINAVDSPDRSTTPWNDYYAEMAVYHDTKGDAIIGGWKIWDVSSPLPSLAINTLSMYLHLEFPKLP